MFLFIYLIIIIFLAQIVVQLLLQILVDAAAGYDLPPSQSFYFLLWASRRLYCHNSGALARAKRARGGTPWVRKFGYDVEYVRPPVHALHVSRCQMSQ